MINLTEESYSSIFNGVPVALAIIEVSGRYVDVNDYYCKTHGFTKEEMIGKLPREIGILTVEEADKLVDAFAAGSFMLKEYEIVYHWKDRTKRVAHLSANGIELGGKPYFLITLIDITEKKEAENKLKESAVYLKKIADTLPAMVFEYTLRSDKSMKLEYVSSGLVTLFGYDPEDALSDFSTIWEANHPDDIEELLKSIERSAKEFSVWEHEYRVKTKGGEYRWVHGHSIPHKKNENGDVSWIGTLIDIHDQREAQSALMRSEERLRAITRLSPDTIRIIDEKGKTLFVSKESEFYDGENTVSKVHPEDRKLFYETLSSISKDPNGVGKLEYRIMAGNAQYVWHETYAMNQLSNPSITGHLLLTRDITERKKAEEKMLESSRFVYTLLNSIPVMVCWKDTESRYLGGNSYFLRMIRRSSDSELIGKSDFEIFDEKDAVAFTEFDKEVLQTGEAKVFYEDPLHENGEIRWVMKSKTPLKDAKGKVIGILVTGQDITSQKKALIALEESEAKYRSLFENMTSAFCLHQVIYDELDKPVDFRFLEVNPAFEKLTGRREEELIGRKMTEMFRIEPDRMEVYKKAAITGKPLCFESHSGEFDLWADIFVFTPRKGHLAIIFNDSTARKVAERALKESEELFRGVIQNAPAVIYSINKNGVFTLSEGQALSNLGLTSGQVVGQSIFEVYKDYPDILEFIKRGLNGEKLDAESTVGDVILESRYSHTYDEKGQIRGIIGVSIDITDRKRIERQLKESENNTSAIFQSISDAITVIRLSDGRIMEANPGFEVQVGIKKERLLELTADELHMEFPIGQREVLRDLLKHNGQVDNFELTIFYGVTGLTIAGLLTVRKIMFKGELCHMTHFRDITDRKKAEDKITRLNVELEQMVKERTSQLQEANNDLEAFAYSISHDLRAPIRHIDGFAKLLFKEIDQPSETANRNFQRVISSAKRMSQMIDDLLAFSRLGRKDISKNEVDLDNLVSQILNDYREEWRNDRLIWKIDPLGKIHGDKNLLRMVFENLMSNAVKYSSKKERPIIEMGVNALEGEMVEYFVKDNGAGFDMNYVHKLFQVFQRLHTDEEFIGTGIGLANVRQIVKKHNGYVRAEGELGKYAVFYIILPKHSHDS